MKKQILLSILLIISLKIYSQDFIIKKTGDTIKCKITDIKEDMIRFDYKYMGTDRTTYIFTKDIKSYTKDLSKVDFIPKKDTVILETPVVNNKVVVETPKQKPIDTKYKKFRFSANAGYSYMFAHIESSLPLFYQHYLEKLKSGYNLNFDVDYYFSRSVGLGVKYNYFNTKNSLSSIYAYTSDGTLLFGQMVDNITIQNIGPVLSFRFKSNKNNNCFVMNIGLMYSAFKNDGMFIIPMTMTGKNISGTFDFGYDICLYKNLYLGINTSIYLGSISKVHITSGNYSTNSTLSSSSKINISHLDINGGLRYSF